MTLTVFLLWRCLRRRDFGARASLVRLVVVACAAAFFFLPLVMPAVPQAMKFLRGFRGALEYTWPVSAWSHYAAGVAMPDGNQTVEWEGGWHRGYAVAVHRGALES
ncbi:MAG: hypothetical protein ACR2OZ_03355 [Verrucomicrobiales bacterium]